MRSCASRPPRPSGFTLLEMVLAMACTGILVALLVTVFIQMTRTSTAVMAEAAQQRRQDKAQRDLEALLAGLRWRGDSISGDSGLPWTAAEGRWAVWSSETFGQGPGPERWMLESRPDGLTGQGSDPTGLTPPVERRWEEVQALRIEGLRGPLAEGVDEARWTDLAQWDPRQPFKPLALRLRVRWKGQDSEACLTRTL